MNADQPAGQGDLFSLPQKPEKPKTEQQKNLERVRGNIAPAVLAWCRKRFSLDRFFHMRDLCFAVANETGCALDSPRRIYHLLCDEGQIRATNLSRDKSYYRLDEVKP